jgi:surface polysaccharide O-acyltransferase-like enzyme
METIIKVKDKYQLYGVDKRIRKQTTFTKLYLPLLCLTTLTYLYISLEIGSDFQTLLRKTSHC